MTAQATPAVAEETKADKFKRIGNKRVEKALDAIAGLKGLANTASYEYTDEQVQKIGAVLTKAVSDVGAAFAAKGKQAAASSEGIL